MTCGKCKLHYLARDWKEGDPRCRCLQHCPCRGLCSVGCACEALVDALARAVAARRDPCALCHVMPEVAGGVRLCRGCLETAGVILEAIKADEAKARLVDEEPTW